MNATGVSASEPIKPVPVMAWAGAAAGAAFGASGRVIEGRRLILMSFDVEEFDITLEYGHRPPIQEQLRVGAAGFARVLEVLDELSSELRRPVVATLFTTARIGEHCPELMHRAAKQHEIASHGFTHAPELREGDLERSREVLRALTGQEIAGFRRPRFAPTDLALIARAGFSYNSSEQPTYMPGRYNNLSKPRRAYAITTSAGPLMQVPVSVAPGCRAPLSWLAFKNFPYFAVAGLSALTLRHDGACNFLWHPWEFMDLSGQALPRYVKAIDGEALVARLKRFVHFLAPMGEFATFSEHVARVNATGGRGG